jgi:hypothetical protein
MHFNGWRLAQLAQRSALASVPTRQRRLLAAALGSTGLHDASEAGAQDLQGDGAVGVALC